MDAIFRALADPTVRGWYLALCFSVMILPMIAITWWYHARIRKTAGGRDLMMRHARIGVPGRSNPVGAVVALWLATRLARDVSAGGYGDAVRRMQNVAYAIIGVWLVANIVLFGILIWADEVNRTTQ